MMFRRKLFELHRKAHRAAFACYIRKGRVLPFLSEMVEATASVDAFRRYDFKYNHNHDERGRFDFGDGTSDNGGNAPSSGQGAPVSESNSSNGGAQNGNDSGITPVADHLVTLDVAGAVDRLNQAADVLKASQIANGQPNLFGEHACARYVANAIEQGGGLSATPRPADAKNFGSWLESNNFGVVAAWDGQSTLSSNGYVSSYTPQAGDVVVIQPYNGGNPSGHIAMYNGAQWVSDFRQNDIWGGKGYRTEQPNYVVYRYGISTRVL